MKAARLYSPLSPDYPAKRTREQELAYQQIEALRAGLPATIERLTGLGLKAKLTELMVTQQWFGAWLGTDRHQISRWVRRKDKFVPFWLSFVILLLEKERARLPEAFLGIEMPLVAAWPAPERAKKRAA